MIALLKSNNIATLSFVEALLKEAGIDYLMLDQHMSIMEGSIGAIPRRVMVPVEQEARARRVLEEADLAHELENS